MGSIRTNDLKRLLQSLRSANEPQIRVALSGLHTEIRSRFPKGTADSFEFFRSAVHALRQLKGTSNSDIRLQCLHECAQFFYGLGHGRAALEAAEQFHTLAEMSGLLEWRRKSHTLNGILQADNGNIAEALSEYWHALKIASELNDIKQQVGTWMNIGVALNYGSLYHDAIGSFRQAAAIVMSRGAGHDVLPMIYSNMAQSHWYLEQYSQGFEAIQKSLSLFSDPKDAAEAQAITIQEFTLVQIALAMGKISLAKEHAAKCRRFGAWSDSKRSETLANTSVALCEIYGGSVDQGLALITRALDGADADSPNRILILTALVRALDEIGQPESALRYLQTLLAQIRARRERGVCTLLRLNVSLNTSFDGDGNDVDLRGLEFREARLRAKVAEREVINSRIEMLERLAITADLKEEPSGEHGYRVGRLSSLMAEQLGWTKDACHAIDLAARLHDIGKIAVPDRILLNTKELQEAERHFMSTHTIIGAELLAKSNIPHLKMAEEIARSHHEWWDGNGYPSKLSGNRIPLHARMVALADVFDALTHGRPFAAPWPIDQALDFIRERSGSQFDPGLTGRFIELVHALRAKHRDLDGYLARAGRNSPFVQARNKIRMLIEEEQVRDAAAAPSPAESVH